MEDNKDININSAIAFYKLSSDNQGRTGMAGAKYQLYQNVVPLTTDISNTGINLFVKDERGTVLELMNGVSAGFSDNKTENKDDGDKTHDINKRPKDDTSDDDDKSNGDEEKQAACTYEIAQPRLIISNTNENQSSMTINGKEIKIKSGQIWMDRQICNYAATPKGRELYCGNWMTLLLDDGFSIVLASIWREKPGEKGVKPLVWQSGTDLGRPPILSEGNVYYPLPDSIKKYYQRNNGGKFLTENNFTVNILNAKEPDQSPHWKSGLSGNTYCTAWKVDINLDGNYERSLYVYALVDKCENGNFWEGATLIYADKQKTKLIGNGWSEQMGYN